jgi:hypothetical protein
VEVNFKITSLICDDEKFIIMNLSRLPVGHKYCLHLMINGF